MRISRIDISRFGRIRDRTFEVSPGMTVFYGHNESGKTTTMEFIRSTLVPSAKRNLYPERTKGDSGSITVDDGGVEREITLEYRSRGGDVPECIRDQDPELFRGIFAMNPSELDDRKVIEEGDVKTRFLTVPGGENMPEVMDSLSDMTNETLGKTSSSRSRYMSNQKDYSDVVERISDIRSRTERYGDLSRQLDEAERELGEIKESSTARNRDRGIVNLYRANADSYARLSELEGSRSALGDFVHVSDEDNMTHNSLVQELGVKEGICGRIADEMEDIRVRLRGADPRKVASFGTEIDSVIEGLPIYRRDRDDLQAIRSMKDSPDVAEHRGPPSVGRRSPALLAAGILMAVIGLVGCLVSPYALVMTAAGAAVMVFGLRRQSGSTNVVHGTVSSEDADRRRHSLEQNVSVYEQNVSRLMTELGLISTGTLSDVEVLKDVRGAGIRISEKDRESMAARMAKMDADSELRKFYTRYSGKEGFEESVRKTAMLKDIEKEIATLRSYISNAGLDPDVPECPIADVEDTSMDRSKEVGQRAGEIKRHMKDLLDMDELDRLMDRKAELESERRDILISGATAIMASAIAEHACTEIYSSVQPGVVETANRYLGMMTDDRYVLDLDPRNNSLSVRSEEGVKGVGMWSTGLKAQVLLSVKLAIAKEMGNGEIPMILDDVLLTFDSDRKMGACRALSEVSEEMQILLFTCDRETSDIASNLDGVSVITM